MEGQSLKIQKTHLLLIDMPFGSYEENEMKAYKNAKKIISETGADAVKLEKEENKYQK